MAARKPLPVDLIDALLADYKKPEDLIGEEGLLKQLDQGPCRTHPQCRNERPSWPFKACSLRKSYRQYPER